MGAIFSGKDPGQALLQILDEDPRGVGDLAGRRGPEICGQRLHGAGRVLESGNASV